MLDHPLERSVQTFGSEFVDLNAIPALIDSTARRPRLNDPQSGANRFLKHKRAPLEKARKDKAIRFAQKISHGFSRNLRDKSNSIPKCLHP